MWTESPGGAVPHGIQVVFTFEHSSLGGAATKCLCVTVCFPVAPAKLSDGSKDILEFCQTSEPMLAENVGVDVCCHGTRAPSIPDTTQVPRLSPIT